MQADTISALPSDHLPAIFLAFTIQDEADQELVTIPAFTCMDEAYEADQELVTIPAFTVQDDA